ncbi:hypothetical protein BJV78DRAFT_1238256 [Lactifluus subvellereus]|nr:hypothetical protein BJV78DRAFT_1238256 [Lactifluus subvellereus]
MRTNMRPWPVGEVQEYFADYPPLLPSLFSLKYQLYTFTYNSVIWSISKYMGRKGIGLACPGADCSEA